MECLKKKKKINDNNHLAFTLNDMCIRCKTFIIKLVEHEDECGFVVDNTLTSTERSYQTVRTLISSLTKAYIFKKKQHITELNSYLDINNDKNKQKTIAIQKQKLLRHAMNVKRLTIFTFTFYQPKLFAV